MSGDTEATTDVTWLDPSLSDRENLEILAREISILNARLTDQETRLKAIERNTGFLGVPVMPGGRQGV